MSCATLLIGTLTVFAADPPSQEYVVLGFRTVKVFDYKKALREAGEEIPRFPSRTTNALIAEIVYSRSRLKKIRSRAKDAGLKDQDIIFLINGELLKTPTDGNKILQKIRYSDALEMRVIRRNENQWERINVQVKPLTDLEYYRTQVFDQLRRDEELTVCRIWSARESLHRFTDDDIQLYFKKKRKEPLQLMIQLELFLPDAPLWKDPETLSCFMIKTDQAEYKLTYDDSEFKKELEVDKQFEETKKSIQIAQEQLDAVAKKYGQDSLEYTEASNTLLVAKRKYIRLEIAEEEELARLRQKSKEDNKVLNANFNKIYANASEQMRKMLDEVLDKLGTQERISNETLFRLESMGLIRGQITLAKMLNGWKYYEMPLKKKQRKMIDDIINSKTVFMYHEREPEKKYEVTPKQKEQMKAVLGVFEAEGGKLGN
tara:strand:- start:1318 stop:2607 length:1290 start_codon:yes stop_codon:yes gene_type:complete